MHTLYLSHTVFLSHTYVDAHTPIHTTTHFNIYSILWGPPHTPCTYIPSEPLRAGFHISPFYTHTLALCIMMSRLTLHLQGDFIIFGQLACPLSSLGRIRLCFILHGCIFHSKTQSFHQQMEMLLCRHLTVAKKNYFNDLFLPYHDKWRRNLLDE